MMSFPLRRGEASPRPLSLSLVVMALFGALLPAPAIAQLPTMSFNVCNEGTIDAHVAVVSKNPLGFDWSSSGWYRIRPSECQDMAGGSPERHYIGISIRNRSGQLGMMTGKPAGREGALQPTRRSFCVHPTDPWRRRGNLEDLARCEGSFQLAEFSATAVGAANTRSTITLRIEPTPASSLRPFRQLASAEERRRAAGVDHVNRLGARLVELIESDRCLMRDGSGVRHSNIRISADGTISYRSEHRAIPPLGREVLTMGDTRRHFSLGSIGSVVAGSMGECSAVQLTCVGGRPCIHVTGWVRTGPTRQSPREQLSPEPTDQTLLRLRTRAAAEEAEKILEEIVRFHRR
jgi:hypothetical protein